MLYVSYAMPPHDAHKLYKHNDNAVQLGPSAGLSWLQHSTAGKSSGNPKILAIIVHILGVWVHTQPLLPWVHTFAARAMLELGEPHTTFRHQHIFLQLLLKRAWS